MPGSILSSIRHQHNVVGFVLSFLAVHLHCFWGLMPIPHCGLTRRIDEEPIARRLILIFWRLMGNPERKYLPAPKKQ